MWFLILEHIPQVKNLTITRLFPTPPCNCHFQSFVSPSLRATKWTEKRGKFFFVFMLLFQRAPCNLSILSIKYFKLSLSKQGGILHCTIFITKNMNKSFNCSVKRLQSLDSEITLHSLCTKTVSLWRAFCDVNTQKGFWLFYYLIELCIPLQRPHACCSSSTINKQHTSTLKKIRPFNRPPQRNASQGYPTAWKSRSW